ncbi:hypothetical protein [Acinetobacter radioresistens]|uniref:hypothetical protein n=1 Tax=Acinetobacter radioresistens TaxID=40216 RepID=UPI0012506015|nr:hypothetical protein [Acinetobacter radioresistens]
MIDKNIWMEILKLTSQSQSKGEAFYLDGLKEQFPENQLEYNIKYLVDHGLIVKNLTILEDSFGYSELTITGYDFLEKDGGLTREVNEKLNTIFIKIDEEQFRTLLFDKISQMNLPETQKESITSAIKNLPADSLTHLATKLLDAGLESLPNALQSIGIG